MKKNMKGFTLIELLAVIVILAVIALIATPIIMNVINDAKKGANKDATFGFAKAVETSVAIKMIECQNLVVESIDADEITISGCADTTLPINYKGTKPSAVDVHFDATTGKLVGDVTFGNNTFNVETGAEVAS